MFDCSVALAEFPYALVAGFPDLPGKRTISAGPDNALCGRG
jgi:hypothetical protein